MARRVPGNRTIALATTGTVYNLYTLLAAVCLATDAKHVLPPKCQELCIQLDIGAGGTRLYIGEADTVSSTDRGVELAAGQVKTYQASTNNLINMKDIGLTASGDNTNVNIAWVTR